MKKRLTLLKILLLTVFCMLPLSSNAKVGSTHPDHTEAGLAELNDYLMALQFLRHENAEAEKLFGRWQELREASWKIRDMTDTRDMLITDPEVEKQIIHTRQLRESLLNNSRTFFEKLANSVPTVRIQLEDELQIDWEDPVIPVPVGNRELVLVQITSGQTQPVDLHLSGEESEEILFWSKSVSVSNQHPRYTFVYVAPTTEGPAETSLSVRWGDHKIREFVIHAEGTLPGGYQWYNHVPDEVIYNLAHTDTPDIQEEIAFDPDKKKIQFRVRDFETGKALPVRVEVRDDDGKAYWTPLRGPSYAVNREEVGWNTPLWTFQPGPFFYIGGDAELGVEPSGKSVSFYHGFEYKPLTRQVPDSGVVEATLERWIDMPALGWYSGHTHIHTTDAGIPVQYSRFWPLVTRAEGLGVSAILTLQGERRYHSIYADEYPMGPLESHSTASHLITYGQEYRNNPYGHLALLGLDELITPVSSGALGEVGGPDYPPNQFILDEALSQGATTIGAHFGNYVMGNNTIGSTWPSTGFEMPVNVALGNIHLAEIYGNAGQLEVWYKLLNAGFNLFATAGPDWVMKDTPRVYVFLGEKPLSVDNWVENLRLGHSFITTGPMLFFKVGGEMPGSQIHFAGQSNEITVEASALIPDGSQPVEIVVNGEVVASGTDLKQTIELSESAWMAARTEGAHSNPVFVTLGGQPRRSAEDLSSFIDVTERLKEWVNTKGLFENQSQKETVLRVLNQGQDVFEGMIEEAKYLKQ